MDGLILLVLALFLIVAEAFVPSFGLLGLAGIITFLVGSHYAVEAGGILGIELSWGFFLGVLAVVTIPMAISAFLFGRHYKSKLVAGTEGLIGDDAKVVEWSGKNGRVTIQGELWSAISDSDLSLKPDDVVTVTSVNDMNLKITSKS